MKKLLLLLMISPMVGFGQNLNMDDLEEEEIKITSPYKDSHKALKLGKEITKLKAELDSVTEELNSITLISIESMPRIIGFDVESTELEIIKFISRNFKYPEIAKENGVAGKIYIEFFVEECGHVDRVKVLKGGLSKEIDKAAIEVIRLLPKFVPGRSIGKRVPVKFTVPIICTPY